MCIILLNMYIYIYNMYIKYIYTNLVGKIVKLYYEMDSSCKVLTNSAHFQNPPPISEFF